MYEHPAGAFDEVEVISLEGGYGLNFQIQVSRVHSCRLKHGKYITKWGPNW